ncbi:transposase [Malonomonas rubra]|uniref:transposase n=1 Tax=Malonomonas rubra TaxID=57040 RepID=UPI0026F14910|nr:transposase [Malonomonas rubra]
MERIPRQFYTQGFRQEAVNLVINGGLSVAEVSRRLSISQQTLRNWIKKHKGEGLAASGSSSITDLEAENSRFSKELAEARLEKEILKKAMVDSTDRRYTL